MSEESQHSPRREELEALSALMDGEAGPLELRRLLRELGGESELRARWARMHRVRDALAGGDAGLLSIDVSGAVRSALEQDPSQERAGWRRSLASFGVAASVAAAVLLAVPQMTERSEGDGPTIAPLGIVSGVGGVPVRASLGQSAQPAGQDVSIYSELAAERLRRFEAEHNLDALPNSPVLPPVSPVAGAGSATTEPGER